MDTVQQVDDRGQATSRRLSTLSVSPASFNRGSWARVAWARNAITEGRDRFRIGTEWFSRSGCWNRRAGVDALELDGRHVPASATSRPFQGSTWRSVKHVVLRQPECLELPPDAGQECSQPGVTVMRRRSHGVVGDVALSAKFANHASTSLERMVA